MGNVFEMQVETTPLPLSRPSMLALARIASYDWMLFTSQNTVCSIVQMRRDKKFHLPSHIRVAAVGSRTAAALRRHNIRVDVVPQKETVREMVRRARYYQRKENTLSPLGDSASRDNPRNTETRCCCAYDTHVYDETHVSFRKAKR
jgi:uroporphyrinogen-III synthase